MPTRQEWNNIIKGRGGKTGESTVHCIQIYADDNVYEHVDGSWFYHDRGDEKKKPTRDSTAREMRKDGWDVKTETNSLGYFLKAKRRRK